MDVKIEYRDADGRRVNSLEDAMRSVVDRAVTQRIEQVTCPEHGAQADHIEIVRDGDEITYTAGPLCCERLKDEIAAAFSDEVGGSDMVSSERQVKRDTYLRALYEQTDGDTTETVYGTGELAGITDDNELLDITRYLEQDGLVDFRTSGFGVGITDQGANTVERSFAPNSPEATRVAEKEADRVAFLVKIYDMVGGSDMEYVNYREVAEALGWDGQRAAKTMNYLNGHGLARWMFLGGGLGITHKGIRWVEQHR